MRSPLPFFIVSAEHAPRPSAPMRASAAPDTTPPAPGIEAWLAHLLPPADAPPQTLHRALHDVVSAGRPHAHAHLCLHVATACGAAGSELALRAACAVELCHLASRVHAPRPGAAAPAAHVPRATALLAGDALLTLAFETVAAAPAPQARRALRITQLLARGAAPKGPRADAEDPLLRLAAETGAVAAGAADAPAWAQLGERLGAYRAMARTDGRRQALLAALCAQVTRLTLAPAPLLAFLAQLD